MRSGKTSGITGSKLWEAHLNFQPEPQILKKIQLTMKNIDQHLAGLKNSLKKPCNDIRSSIDNFGVLSGSILKQSEKSLIAKNQFQNLKIFHSKYFNTQKYFWGSNVIRNLQEVISMIGFFSGKKIKSTALLYRASQNGFDLGKFHEKCDGVPCTLTICETQFSKKIGGYTPIQWKKLSSPTYQKDDSGQSFVFSLSNNDKFILEEKQNAVCHRSDGYEPHFGNGDFILCNKSNQSQKCYGRINYSYVNNKYKKDDKQSWERFIGSSSNTHYFRTKQWQVWKIEFQA